MAICYTFDLPFFEVYPMTVRTRFAPSPTGFLHIGGARTALFCWAFARKHKGTFVLRIEDTDRQRSTEASVQAILDSMAWLGLDADEGPYYQTQRFDRYAEVVESLLNQGNAYRCYCTKEELETIREEQRKLGGKPRYDGRCRNRQEPRAGVEPVVRFKNPEEGKVVIDDLVRGEIVIDNKELDDLIIARSDGTPTYNFTVVVDDMDMKITHVIRGDDHVNNTPRQINIFKALDAEPPAYAHVPMILGEDGSRLSKRHGAVGVMEYAKQGYLPDALLNYLVRLGWSHGDQEIFSREEMVDLFDLAGVNKAASTFNPEKLDWLNQEYIKLGEGSKLGPILSSHYQTLGVDVDQGPDPVDVVQVYRERAKTLQEMAESSVYLYQDFEQFDEKAAKKNLRPVALEPMKALKVQLQEIEVWRAEAIHGCIQAVSESLELGMGKVAQPLRVAVTGGGVSPPIDATVELVGRERTLARLDRAIGYAEERAANA